MEGVQFEEQQMDMIRPNSLKKSGSHKKFLLPILIIALFLLSIVLIYLLILNSKLSSGKEAVKVYRTIDQSPYRLDRNKNQ